ncbi:methyltransferase domain-containing protein [Croceitalea rosinachiae]|uniref:Methyltransferase domain-containing protein n=1 Tax=Croceitalea rosinachiae TaxID=3075596 RepID=A0ABU3ACC3_9FLAO|nr:methyltransferase domain-containing protein [Croceitalea sp. F388]MDT0607634.1 methyltransferase domain-containing protein [Croceitalea sp. F388]
MDFTSRSKESELMDDPKMDAEKYREAYLDINRCNRLLGGYGITINAVKSLLKKPVKKSYTILDMGCGDGEMLRRISKAFEKQGLEAKLIGVDLRDDVLDIARSKSKEYTNINFTKQDILELKDDFDCDIVLCTLTMHHFTDEQIHIFLKKFNTLAKIGVVINDLERSKLSYGLFKLFSIVFIKTAIAKYDGLVSISKGFRKKELLTYSRQLKTAIHTIKWKWAFRYVWVMQTNRLN